MILEVLGLLAVLASPALLIWLVSLGRPRSETRI